MRLSIWPVVRRPLPSEKWSGLRDNMGEASERSRLFLHIKSEYFDLEQKRTNLHVVDFTENKYCPILHLHVALREFELTLRQKVTCAYVVARVFAIHGDLMHCTVLFPLIPVIYLQYTYASITAKLVILIASCTKSYLWESSHYTITRYNLSMTALYFLVWHFM